MVEPVGKVQQVQSRYPGSIEKLDVSVGDMVKKGEILVVLDTQEAISTFNMAKNKIALLEKERAIYQKLVDANIEPMIKLVQIDQRLLEATDQKQRAELQLKFSNLTSPISGVITAVNPAGIAAVVRAGDILVEVVPQEEYYLIKA